MNQYKDYEAREKLRQEKFNGIPRYWLLTTHFDRHYVVDIATSNMVQAQWFKGAESFSNQWRLVGFSAAEAFGRMSHAIPTLEFISTGKYKDMRFKNDKGKYYVVDFDHGSNRVWGERATRFIPY